MATPGLDIPAQASLAKEWGFHGVDLRVGQPGRGEIPEELSAWQCVEIRNALDGVQVPGLLCYNQKIQAGREALTESVLQNLRLARLLGCPMIRIFTGKIVTPAELDALTDALRAVLCRDDSGIRIGMQIHMNSGVTVAQALAVCKRLQNDRVGIILSPDQSVLSGDEWEHLLPEAAPHVFQVYVADIDEAGQFTTIGDGVIDFAGILDTLYQNGFDGYVTLKWEKCWLAYLPDHPEGFRSFLRYLQKHAFLP